MKEIIRKKSGSLEFFAKNPVFTLESFTGFLRASGRPSEENSKRLLSYHKKQGHLLSVRAGLYASVPLAASAKTFLVDPFLIASYLTRDAVLGYHSALTFHGVAHSRREEMIVITQHPLVRPFRFQGMSYRTVSPPTVLITVEEPLFAVETRDRQGQEVRVTGLERTLVDALDRLHLSGGWEEVWRSYETVPYLDLDTVVHYALLLDNATTIAKVGFFLQSQQERWMVGEEVLITLRDRRPRQPHYVNRNQKEAARLISEWNLILPESIINRTWEEQHEPLA